MMTRNCVCVCVLVLVALERDALDSPTIIPPSPSPPPSPSSPPHCSPQSHLNTRHTTSIYIHVDKGTDYQLKQAVSNFSLLLDIMEHKSSWGEMLVQGGTGRGGDK